MVFGRNSKRDVLQLKELLRTWAVPLPAEVQKGRDPNSPIDDAQERQGQPPRKRQDDEHRERRLDGNHPVRFLDGTMLAAALMVQAVSRFPSRALVCNLIQAVDKPF